MRTLRSIYTLSSHHEGLGRAMTSQEVKTLSADGLVKIGAHTVTHPVLSGLEPLGRRREITESKFTCESLIGASVGTFAYPYGDFNAATRAQVQAAGFSFGVLDEARTGNHYGGCLRLAAYASSQLGRRCIPGRHSRCNTSAWVTMISQTCEVIMRPALGNQNQFLMLVSVGDHGSEPPRPTHWTYLINPSSSNWRVPV